MRPRAQHHMAGCVSWCMSVVITSEIALVLLQLLWHHMSYKLSSHRRKKTRAPALQSTIPTPHVPIQKIYATINALCSHNTLPLIVGRLRPGIRHWFKTPVDKNNSLGFEIWANGGDRSSSPKKKVVLETDLPLKKSKPRSPELQMME